MLIKVIFLFLNLTNELNTHYYFEQTFEIYDIVNLQNNTSRNIDYEYND